jgi:hypothetical protein
MSRRVKIPDEPRRRLFGNRYVLPQRVTAALEQVFAEPVGGVVVIEHSRYARLHRGICHSPFDALALCGGIGAMWILEQSI